MAENAKQDEQEDDNMQRTSATGTPAIDPTKNVLDVVRSESKYQDGMREAMGKLNEFAHSSANTYQNFARETESRMQSWMRDAESKRVDQLTLLRDNKDGVIAAMLAESVKSTSSLVATQLLQIQSTFGERISKLEEFRLLSTGRSSVADPQLAASLEMMNKNLASTQETFAKTLTEMTARQTNAMAEMARSITALQDIGNTSGGKTAGRGEVVAWMVAAVTIAAGAAAMIAHFLH